MWGGVKGALPGMVEMLKAWPDKKSFMTDMKFLDDIYWESHFKDTSIAHDAFSCQKYINTATR